VETCRISNTSLAAVQAEPAKIQLRPLVLQGVLTVIGHERRAAPILNEVRRRDIGTTRNVE
jgi:hypothetical protein